MEQANPREKLESTFLCYRSLLNAAGGPHSLGGKLVLLGESHRGGQERAAAARIAGAAALLLLEDEAQAKAAVREGACDFLVAGLDEALRILKNELRRRAPVAVCLRACVPAVLSDCVERGVQPDLLDTAEETLVNRGACVVQWERKLGEGEFGASWSAESFPAMEAATSLALQSFEATGGERERWLRQAPPVLGRLFARWGWLPMRAGEQSRFAEAVARNPYARMIRVFPGGG